MKKKKFRRFSLVLILLGGCSFFSASLAKADISESDSTGLVLLQNSDGKQIQAKEETTGNNEKIFNFFHMLVSLPREVSLNDNKRNPPLREIKIPMNERLKAFLSVGAPRLQDLAGKPIKTDYKAFFGFHVAF